jgi:drug/metabolite transporter (DMT)-like permease
MATLILSPIALATGAHRELRALGRRERFLALLSGIALAFHFASWISSLSLTTVASSVVLVSTNPLWVGLVGHFVLRERVSRLTAVGIALAVSGSILIGYGDLSLSREALLGDALALVGAITVSAYFLLGRSLRQRLSILAYIWPVYATAAAVLLIICLLSGQSFAGYEPKTYLMLLLLAIGPQLLGHSSLNYALEQLSAIFVTLAVLGEPIGAAILAFLLLEEKPSWEVFVGGAMILLGILMAGREERGR